ncbi:MAG: hypothetical protein ACRDBG_27685 [Waterburya sp.]
MLEELKDLGSNAMQLISELSSMEDMKGEEKLQRVEDLVYGGIETADNFIELLPLGLKPWAKALVDNPMVDQKEKTMARGIAEILYQLWKAKQEALALGE